jgi:hypothetical protein
MVNAVGLQAREHRKFRCYLAGRSPRPERLKTTSGQAPLSCVAVETGSLIVTGNGMDGRSRIRSAGKVRGYTPSHQQGE